MSLARAIAGNTAIQLSGKVVATLLGLITVGVMTRLLGAAGYGQFTTVLSFLQFFGVLVDFGLTLTMIRMISDPGANEGRIASNILTFRFISGLVFFGLAPLIALAFPYPAAVKAGIALGSFSFLAISLSQVLLGIFQKHLATNRIALAEVIGRVFLLVGVIAIARFGGGLTAIIGILAASNLIQFAVSFAFAQPYVRLHPAFDARLWKKIIIESWPIGLSIAFNLVYLKGDVLILSLSRDDAEVGLYGASYKVLDVITVIPTIFMGLVLPVMASAWSRRDHADFHRKLSRAFDFLSMLAIPLAIGTFPVAADLMSFVAGREFAAAGPLLSTLTLAGAAVCWSALFGHAVVAMGMQKKTIWVYGSDAVLSLLLYFIVVPRYGGAGAAWVTVFSETYIAVVIGAMVIRTATGMPSLRVFGRALLAAAAMYVVLLAATPLHVLLRIALGAASYVFFLALFGGITRETLAMFKKSQPLPL